MQWGLGGGQGSLGGGQSLNLHGGGGLQVGVTGGGGHQNLMNHQNQWPLPYRVPGVGLFARVRIFAALV